MPRGVLASRYYLLQQRMSTPGPKIVQHKWVEEIDDPPVHFVTSVICDLVQLQFNTGCDHGTEKAHVTDEPTQSGRQRNQDTEK